MTKTTGRPVCPATRSCCGAGPPIGGRENTIGGQEQKKSGSPDPLFIACPSYPAGQKSGTFPPASLISFSRSARLMMNVSRVQVST